MILHITFKIKANTRPNTFRPSLADVMQVRSWTPTINMKAIITTILRSFEIPVRRFFERPHIRANSTVIDIGSHVGYYTVLASKIVGKKGKVVSIEPHPTSFSLLLNNIRLWRCKNVVPLNYALSDRRAQMPLWYSRHMDGTLSQFKPVNVSRSVMVQTRTLDEVASKLNLNDICLIKIDVDGAELEILKGAEETLRKSDNLKIIIESLQSLPVYEQMLHLLHATGFSLKVFRGRLLAEKCLK